MMPARLYLLQKNGVRLADGGHHEIPDVWYDREDWVIRYVSTRAHGERYLLPVPLLGVDDYYRLFADCGDADLYPEPRRLTPEYLTRSFEDEVLAHYGIRSYWGGAGIWWNSRSPRSAAHDKRVTKPISTAEPRQAVFVYPTHEIIHETIACPDGAYGWVGDLLIDLDSWSVRYLIVRGLRCAWDEALISPFWGTWDTASDQLRVPFTRGVIAAGPAYRPDSLAPGDEKVLARYYGFARDW